MKNLLDERLKSALKAKDKALVAVLRDIKTKVAKYEKDNKVEIDNDTFITVLKSMAKARNQSIEAYEKAQRSDLVDVEKYELSIIEEYLPKQLSESDIEKAILSIMETIGEPIAMRQMGFIMKEFNSQYKGQNGKLVSDTVKRLIK